MSTPATATQREGYAELGSIRLHYVEAGDGPLIVLLHGFPEFWFGWRHQIPALAAAGFRVVAPDMRGYNLSSKTQGSELLRHRRAGRRRAGPDPRTWRAARLPGRA
jgi:pimeloyl-ACP methyl ester carboxylesterase